jgi:hypothetical protein
MASAAALTWHVLGAVGVDVRSDGQRRVARGRLDPRGGLGGSTVMSRPGQAAADTGSVTVPAPRAAMPSMRPAIAAPGRRRRARRRPSA